MRFVQFEVRGTQHVGIVKDGQIHVLSVDSLDELLLSGKDLTWFAKAVPGGAVFEIDDVTFLPPLTRSRKIICVGLNYADHTKESQYDQPDYPTFFLRVNTSLVAHNQPILRPRLSDSLDFEGELAVILSSGGRNIPKSEALAHVAGYSLFNDGSVREYQFKSPQWTVGKNFDSTGAFGPELVTPEELPAGARGLKLETRLNGEVVQSASTDDMIFDVETLIATISEAITLEAGDVIVTGTPSGIGWARQPKLLMKPGDVCEVRVEGFLPLSNPIVQEGSA